MLGTLLHVVGVATTGQANTVPDCDPMGTRSETGGQTTDFCVGTFEATGYFWGFLRSGSISAITSRNSATSWKLRYTEAKRM